MNQKKGKIFVVSAPSGTGKNTVINLVMKDFPNMRYSISATTRGIRPGEIENVSYYYISEERFSEMLANGELLECTGYTGKHYGTPIKPIRELVEQGYDVVMDVDVVGGLTIHEKIPESVLIFMAPPSMEELHRRLVERNTNKPNEIEARMATAYRELPKAELYDYIIINDKLEQAVEELKAIVTAEKCRPVDRFHFIKEELLCSTPL